MATQSGVEWVAGFEINKARPPWRALLFSHGWFQTLLDLTSVEVIVSPTFGVLMTHSTRFWLAVGTLRNWLTTFEHRYMWGLKASQRRYWEALTPHTDIVFFYVNTPVGGVVGFGLVRNKLHQTSPNWDEELLRNEVIWPLRFEFDVLSAIPPALWKTQRVSREDLKLRARAGFQSLERGIAEELMRALPATLPQELLAESQPGVAAATLALPATPRLSDDPHAHAQHLLVEIGRMQKFLAEPEFPLENRRLDVVWRRVQRSVPSYVFEVQVGGNLTEAMGKLKQARDLWNSNVCLVGKEEHRSAVNQLLGSTFHEIQNHLRFIELAQVGELYQRKLAYRELESQLGILP